MVGLDDEEATQAARQPELLRERQPLRTAAEAAQRARCDGRVERCFEIDEDDLVRILDEGTLPAAVRRRIERDPFPERVDGEPGVRRLERIALARAVLDDREARVLVAALLARDIAELKHEQALAIVRGNPGDYRLSDGETRAIRLLPNPSP